MQEIIWGFLCPAFSPSAFEVGSNLGGVQWQHYTEGGEKIPNLGWTLGLLPETVGIIFVSESFFYNDAPPCHYSL